MPFCVNWRPIRHIFHRFQNVPASCERNLSLRLIVKYLNFRYRSHTFYSIARLTGKHFLIRTILKNDRINNDHQFGLVFSTVVR